jgi:microcystin-dependent protein
VAVVVGVFVATGVSWASIPDSGGVIHGCYKTSGSAHALKIIDNTKTATCPKGSTALNWDQSPPGLGVSTGGATGGAQASDCVLGQISLYAGNTIPANEMAADGQTLMILSNEPLANLLGTTYGGDGLTTFGLPALESLAPNDMSYTICGSGLYP